MVFGDFYPKGNRKSTKNRLSCDAQPNNRYRCELTVKQIAHEQTESRDLGFPIRFSISDRRARAGQRQARENESMTGESEREREDCGDINDFRNGNIVDIVTLSERPHIFIYADTWTFALTGTESRGERSVAEPTHPGNFSGVTPSSRSPTFLCDFL